VVAEPAADPRKRVDDLRAVALAQLAVGLVIGKVGVDALDLRGNRPAGIQGRRRRGGMGRADDGQSEQGCNNNGSKHRSSVSGAWGRAERRAYGIDPPADFAPGGQFPPGNPCCRHASNTTTATELDRLRLRLSG